MKTKKTITPKNKKDMKLPLYVTNAMAEANCLGACPQDAHGHHYAAMAHLRAADVLRMFRFSVQRGTAALKKVDALYLEHLKEAKRHINNIIA